MKDGRKGEREEHLQSTGIPPALSRSGRKKWRKEGRKEGRKEVEESKLKKGSCRKEVEGRLKEGRK
jgi:hypothetical protein